MSPHTSRDREGFLWWDIAPSSEPLSGLPAPVYATVVAPRPHSAPHAVLTGREAGEKILGTPGLVAEMKY